MGQTMRYLSESKKELTNHTRGRKEAKTKGISASGFCRSFPQNTAQVLPSLNVVHSPLDTHH